MRSMKTEGPFVDDAEVSASRCDRKWKVMIVGGFPKNGEKIYGGIVTSCRALADSVFAERFDVVEFDSTQKSNPPPPLSLRVAYSLSKFTRFFWSVLTVRPDAVILFTSVGASVIEKSAMAWVARLFGVKSLMFPRGGALIEVANASKLQRVWIRFALQRANYLLCQGPKWFEFAVQAMGFTPERAFLVPNWTATDSLLEIGKHRKYSPEEKLNLIFVGWLEMEKGIFELLQACSALAKEIDFSLTIVGRGHAESAAREFVSANGLSERVVFAGWLDTTSLEDLLRTHNIFVLPSWAEGLPNSMIEAMAAGLSVVVSKVGNIPEVLVSNTHALLVPAKSSQCLYTALKELCTSFDLRVSLARNAHQLAANKYAKGPAIDLLIKAVESTLGRESYGI